MREVGALLDAGAVHGKRTARAHLRWLADAGGAAARAASTRCSTRSGCATSPAAASAASRSACRSGSASRRRCSATRATLLFDEPINGLDPEGIRWIRTLLQRFAAEGRTVVVSSHLMHEMEETADHVLVIGRGRLIADTSIAEFTLRARGQPRPRRLARRRGARRRCSSGAGGQVSAGADGALTVAGLAAAADRRPRRRARAARCTS